jgi:hypothetical protein
MEAKNRPAIHRIAVSLHVNQTAGTDTHPHSLGTVEAPFRQCPRTPISSARRSLRQLLSCSNSCTQTGKAPRIADRPRLPVRVPQHEVIQKRRKLFPRDADSQICKMREVALGHAIAKDDGTRTSHVSTEARSSSDVSFDGRRRAIRQRPRYHLIPKKQKSGTLMRTDATRFKYNCYRSSPAG